MLGDRPQADRILIAQLTGEARHRAKWRDLTEAEHAAAVGELRELAAGRADLADLLAEVAGIFEGASEGELGEPLARQAAQLCRDAGADLDAIPAWVEEGRQRRAAAGLPPLARPPADVRRHQGDRCRAWSPRRCAAMCSRSRAPRSASCDSD
jgi:hypothetical protein